MNCPGTPAGESGRQEPIPDISPTTPADTVPPRPSAQKYESGDGRAHLPEPRDARAFACKNTECGWTGNADWNAARNILHLYRIGPIIMEIPAAGRRGRKAGKSVKPVAER
ncbi:hypothetical protein GCM10022207_91560 [Streptomyces lannensis]|uniref:Cas12f1-like TNB domain-containing protein n=1 Tax=Streptomyces lannensis TaxID=766498 RepID=A0ABP7LSF2_9ACTN